MARKRGTGRVTAPGQRRVSRKVGGIHLLPTEITMHRELIDGQDCITVQYEMPNVTFAIPLGLQGWRQFCDDIETLIEKGRAVERKSEDVTGSGIVIPSSDDVKEHGIVSRLR